VRLFLIVRIDGGGPHLLRLFCSTEIGVGVNHTPAALTWFEAPFFSTKICFENKMYLSNHVGTSFTMSGVALAAGPHAVVVGVRTLW
jgi:hypothetical protein